MFCIDPLLLLLFLKSFFIVVVLFFDFIFLFFQFVSPPQCKVLFVSSFVFAAPP